MKSLNLELSRWTWNPKQSKVHCTILIEFNSMKKYKLTTVESFITQHIPIIDHFVIFFHSLTKLNNFCVIGCANWRITNDTKMGCCSLVRAPYFRHFEFCFEWFKTWWVCQIKFYKTSLNSRSKHAMIKDFKLEILIYFDSPLYEHWTLYTKHSTSFLIPFSIWAIFTMLEA